MSEESKHIGYHIITKSLVEAKVGDVIVSPFKHSEVIHDAGYLDSFRPNGAYLRSEALFLSREEDIGAWAYECLPTGSDSRLSFDLLTLEFEGEIKWYDKNLYNQYLLEKRINKGACLDELREKCAKEYWDSGVADDEIRNYKHDNRQLYEGLFYGKAKVIKRERIDYNFREQCIISVETVNVET